MEENLLKDTLRDVNITLSLGYAFLIASHFTLFTGRASVEQQLLSSLSPV